MSKLEEFYPPEDAEIFTNRIKELRLLEFYLDEFLKKRKKDLCFFGLRRIGKTVLVGEFLQRIQKKGILFACLNLQSMVGTLNEFVLSFIGSLVYWVYGGGDIRNYYRKDFLLAHAPSQIKEELLEIIREIEKKEPNALFLLNSIFNFPGLIAEKEKKNLILVLDGFQDLILIENLKKVKQVLGIFRNYLKKGRVWYLVLGSRISVLTDFIDKESSPLFLQLEKVPLYNFDYNSAKKLIIKLFPSLKQDNLQRKIYYLTQGHPYYIVQSVKKIKEYYFIEHLKLNLSLVYRAFIFEVLNKDGNIYSLFRYIYDTSLEKARYKVPLKTILRRLAWEEGLTATDLAKILDITSATARIYLHALKEVDLIIEDNYKYFFRDKVFRVWVAYVEFGRETEVTKDKISEVIIRELEEKYLQASTELGKAKEYEWKVKLEEEFNLKLENYQKKNTEFDLVGKKKEKGEEVYYIFEIKHRNKPVNYNDIKKFLDKIKKSEFKDKKKKLFFISKNGFTKEAEEKAKKEKVSKILYS